MLVRYDGCGMMANWMLCNKSKCHVPPAPSRVRVTASLQVLHMQCNKQMICLKKSFAEKYTHIH